MVEGLTQYLMERVGGIKANFTRMLRGKCRMLKGEGGGTVKGESGVLEEEVGTEEEGRGHSHGC